MHEVQRHTISLKRIVTPTTLAEALGVIGEQSRLIAGGTDLLLELDRGVRPEIDTLIDISRIPDLDRIELDGDQIVIGPLVTHNQIVTSDLVRARAMPLAQACWEIGSPQLRNRATVVGNLVTASPANDTITPLRVLDAELDLTSVDGTRSVSLADFHTGVRRNALMPGEIVTAVRFRALRDNERAIFLKLGNRRAQAISVVHLTAVVGLADGVVVTARLALGSVAPTIVEIDMSSVIGTGLEDEAIASAATEAAAAVTPIDDVRATAGYRSDTIPVMVTRALRALRDNIGSILPSRAVTLGQSRPSPHTSTSHDVASHVEATVNNQMVSAPGATATLLDWLRDGAGLTGSKEGCAEGECGACTVYLDGLAVMACLVPASRAHGSTVTTIEGIANGSELHPLQQAFIDETAVQCGFCIPGFIMSGAMLLADTPEPTTSEIEVAFSGNLCRCTGYYPIISAVRSASRRMTE